MGAISNTLPTSQMFGDSKEANGPTLMKTVDSGIQADFNDQLSSIKSHPFFQQNKYVIDPRSKYMMKWDMVTFCALIFTALTTPFEIAFLNFTRKQLGDFEGYPRQNLYWSISRIVDCIFLKDFCMQWILKYKTSQEKGGRWISAYDKIAWHYIKGWFWVDSISIVPFDVLGMLLDSKSVQNYKLLRVIRLLRLLKLVRILKASRIFKRWENRIVVSSGVMMLIKFVILALMSIHWLACIWGILPQFEDGTNWMNYFVDHHERWGEMYYYMYFPGVNVTIPGHEDVNPESSTRIYCACLYTSVLAMLGGVGDIYPVTHSERGCIVMMIFVGSTVWAYIIGSVCGVIATLDPYSVQFRQLTDEMNYYMKDKQIGSEIAWRVRDYVRQSEHLMRAKTYVGLIQNLSPTLKSEVCLDVVRKDLDKVWYLRPCGDPFLASLALMLKPSMCAPREMMLSDRVSIVQRGVVAKNGRILSKGKLWGYDMILEAHHLKDLLPATALTYVEINTLTKPDFLGVLTMFPEEIPFQRRATLKLALIRSVVYTAKETLRAQGDFAGSLLVSALNQATKANADEINTHNDLSVANGTLDSINSAVKVLKNKSVSVAKWQGRTQDSLNVLQIRQKNVEKMLEAIMAAQSIAMPALEPVKELEPQEAISDGEPSSGVLQLANSVLSKKKVKKRLSAKRTKSQSGAEGGASTSDRSFKRNTAAEGLANGEAQL